MVAASSRARPRGPVPRSVEYARGLLTFQAVVWAIVAVGSVAVWADRANWKPAAHSPVQLAAYILAGNGAVALAAGLAAGSALLAAGLGRGRASACLAAVLLEAGLACFGVIVADYAASSGAGIIAAIPVLAGLGGGALSLAAAVVLLRKSARRFTTGHRASGAGPGLRPGE
jgi:hypothetical protein